METGDPSPEVKEQLASELASYEKEKPWRERQEVEEAALDGGKEAPAIEPPTEDDEEEPADEDEDEEPVVKREPRRPFD